MRSRTGRAAAAAVAVVLLLTGCSGADPSDEDDAARGGAEGATTGPGTPSDAGPGRRTPRLPAVLAEALHGEPSRARTPRQAVRQVVAAELAIADDGTGPPALAAAARVQQVAYRVLGERPAWDARVRRLLPDDLRRVVADNVASRREFRSMHTSDLSRTVPAWRIVAPVPAPRLRGIFRVAERRFGVDWEYLAAVMLVETGMGRIRGTSVAGAQGPMQFIPTTWAAYGRGDIDDPRDAVMAAARYLRARGFTEPGGVDRALYSYNNHPAYARGVRLLAEVMQRRPRAYLAYHHWEVYYLTARGDVRLPVGYAERRPVPVGRYLARG
ncbi:hypothetical protein GCM10023340_36020 [Nocardioides marinquilinus]|uniref:Transglycosylase SLT domain-containing protein n=1 Tax=Nocardioides marinquilinus TaxID=1210400 RepID=A0ABP9Q058_9ACTN